MSDQIPIVEDYRGVGLHDQQDSERLAVVRADIDAVFAIGQSLPDLLRWVQTRSKSPESRLLAKALIETHVEMATDQRRARPNVDMAWLNAVVMGLGSVKWRSKSHFCTIVMPRPGPPGLPENPVRRPVPLAPLTSRR